MTNYWLKLIQSLDKKKFRDKHQLFLVEGGTMLKEAVRSGWQIEKGFITESFFKEEENTFSDRLKAGTLEVTDEKKIQQASSLKTNRQGVALLQLPERQTIPDLTNISYLLLLDRINDPGNLGAIIRIADWFDISQIICSAGTVDCFNPKVISASRGSIFRVDIAYDYLPDVLQACQAADLPVWGADMEGKNVRAAPFPKKCALLMGSESHGIDAELQLHLAQKITIPRLGGAESLNVAMATAILCDRMTS